MDRRKLACISLALVVGAVTLESIQLSAVGFTNSPVDEDPRPDPPENDYEHNLKIYDRGIVRSGAGQGPN
ncbi:MAG: hypothetical protein ACFFGZ_18425 [Candidatus Thorarchaeota archaeon]